MPNKTLRLDRNISSKVMTVYIFCIEDGWVLRCHTSFFQLNVFLSDTHCSIEPWLQIGSQVQTYCVDLKRMEQSILFEQTLTF